MPLRVGLFPAKSGTFSARQPEPKAPETGFRRTRAMSDEKVSRAAFGGQRSVGSVNQERSRAK
jgi:hypothetical protein